MRHKNYKKVNVSKKKIKNSREVVLLNKQISGNLSDTSSTSSLETQFAINWSEFVFPKVTLFAHANIVFLLIHTHTENINHMLL
jgi:hypothetical protein